MYKTVSEIAAALGDRSHAEAVMKKVSKGRKGDFDYIPWNETVGLLNRIFGHFGWSAEVVGSYNDFERGIYRTDMTLTVRALDDETGQVVEKKLPGTGACEANPLSHEDAIKGSRSDAISVAAKGLGDAFGLFLYDKGDPARDGGGAPASDTGVNLGPRPTEKQAELLHKAGYSDMQLAGMAFKDWRACLDAFFKKLPLPIAPARAAQGAVPTAKVPAMDEDEIPY